MEATARPTAPTAHGTDGLRERLGRAVRTESGRRGPGAVGSRSAATRRANPVRVVSSIISAPIPARPRRTIPRHPPPRGRSLRAQPGAHVHAVAAQEVRAVRVRDQVDDLRDVDDHRIRLGLPRIGQDVVGGEIAVHQPEGGEVDHRLPQALRPAADGRRIRAGLLQARSGDGAVRIVGADELHQQLGADDLHRIGDRETRLPQPSQHVELGAGPLPGRDLLAEGGALGDRPALAGVGAAPTLGVGVRAVEGRVLGGAVALGDQQRTLPGSAGEELLGQGPLEQEGVGLLAGLQHPQLGVDRPVVLDHPVGEGLRSAVQGVGGLGPGGPALVVVELGDGEGVHGLREEGVPVEGRGHGVLLREGLRGAQQVVTEGRTAGVSTATTIWSSFPQGGPVRVATRSR